MTYKNGSPRYFEKESRFDRYDRRETSHIGSFQSGSTAEWYVKKEATEPMMD